ncbi:MAG: hypothetical protein QOF17_240 [Solirubrobacteraceae bacterium]|nr:hypothetical protein [Solirubrobacteraceae bacterium]
MEATDRIARIAFALLCLGFAVGFLAFPTYPNYDSYYSLLWGREVVDLATPVFEGFRIPTEHPLAIAVGAILGLFGHVGDRLFVGLILASYLWLVWGVYRLARISFTAVVGGIAVLLLLTRFDFTFLAARGYIDVPYMALVVWAAVLEAARPRRGAPVLLLLAAAGLLRPEGWVLAGLYWLWLVPRATWRQRARYAALAAIGPVLWCGVDLAVTGNPLFSLLYTSGSAEDLGRSRPLSQLPSTLPEFFGLLLKVPVELLAIAGIAFAAVAVPRRMAMPFVLFASGLATFVLIGAAGASVIERYLAVAAVALIVFAGVALGGWTMLERSAARRIWAVAAIAFVIGGAAFTATRLDLGYFDNELSFRGAAHRDLASVLASAPVRRGLRCGPLTVPNHKLVPDSRWIAGLPADRVIARADPKAPRPGRGVAIVVTSRFAIFKHAWTSPSDDPRIQLPPPGFERRVTTRFYAAYVRC